MNNKYTNLEQVLQAYERQGFTYSGDENSLKQEKNNIGMGMTTVKLYDKDGNPVPKTFEANDYELIDLTRKKDSLGNLVWAMNDISEDLNVVNLSKYGVAYCSDLVRYLVESRKETEKLKNKARDNRNSLLEEVYKKKIESIREKTEKWAGFETILKENENVSTIES